MCYFHLLVKHDVFFSVLLQLIFEQDYFLPTFNLVHFNTHNLNPKYNHLPLCYLVLSEYRWDKKI